jgi:V8-like Glu-specific endopeptidase
VTGYVHYYGNKFALLTHSNTVNPLSISNGGIFYDIDTQAGQSGCPVYSLKDNSKLVAIHKAFNPLKRLNFGTLITESVISVLKSWA